MPLDEIALEELGLAPRWVRKGLRAGDPLGEGGGAVEERPAVAPPASASVDTRSGLAQGVVAPVSSLAQAEPRRQPSAADADPARGIAERRSVQTQSPEPVVAQAAQRKLADSGGPGDDLTPEPLADDDFAWFDAAPAPAADARQRADVPMADAPASGDIATLDWDTLAERVASCTRCRLCEKRTNTVFGVGDREAEWMLIGEAPGENEDRQGEPFVGQAGKLLDNMLRALSLARGDNVYIANVIKCRPPGNRNPEPDEVARCEPYLQRQVALVRPKIIVALGRFAAQSLLKTDGSIASLRGRVHRYEGVPVVVTYHPAYLLRSLQDKSKAWADLCLARDTWRAASGNGG